MGLEPTTPAATVQCSAIELRSPYARRATAVRKDRARGIRDPSIGRKPLAREPSERRRSGENRNGSPPHAQRQQAVLAAVLDEKTFDSAASAIVEDRRQGLEKAA